MLWVQAFNRGRADGLRRLVRLTIRTQINCNMVLGLRLQTKAQVRESLTSNAGTGSSRLSNFFTATFMSEKNAWDAATRSMPVLLSTVSFARASILCHPVRAFSNIRLGWDTWGIDSDAGLGAGMNDARWSASSGMSKLGRTSGVMASYVAREVGLMAIFVKLREGSTVDLADTNVTDDEHQGGCMEKSWSYRRRPRMLSIVHGR